jgi:four helix bundle protein
LPENREELSVAVTHYRELIAWQRAMDLVEQIYKVTRNFPDGERYGLTNQLRRASVSVPSNIAEGQGRGVGGEFAHHLRIANGSRQEVETQVLIAERLGFLDRESALATLKIAEEVGRLVGGLHRSIL